MISISVCTMLAGCQLLSKRCGKYIQFSLRYFDIRILFEQKKKRKKKEAKSVHVDTGSLYRQ